MPLLAPTRMHLRDMYLPEFEDSKHRSIDISTPLYEIYQQSTDRDTLSFSDWLVHFEEQDIELLSLPDGVLEIFLNEHPSILERLTTNVQCVHYIHPDYLEHYRITFDADGRAIQNETHIVNDTGMKKAIQPVALVINANDEASLYGGTLIRNNTHHSSYSSGGDTFFAAKVFFLKGSSGGIISCITDESGHYKPVLKTMIYGLQQMLIQGADLSEASLIMNSWSTCLDGDPMTRRYENIGLFLEIYSNGYASDAYMEFDTTDEAIEAFLESDSIMLSTCYIKNTTDLYELTKSHDSTVVITSFYEKYSTELSILKARVEAEARVTHGQGGGGGLFFAGFEALPPTSSPLAPADVTKKISFGDDDDSMAESEKNSPSKHTRYSGKRLFMS